MSIQPNETLLGRAQRLHRHVDKTVARLEEIETSVLVDFARQCAAANKKFGPRLAIKQVLKIAPRTPTEVVRVLRGCVDSTSTNVGKTIFTTIGQMQEAGRIRVRPDGAIELAQEELELA